MVRKTQIINIVVIGIVLSFLFAVPVFGKSDNAGGTDNSGNTSQGSNSSGQSTQSGQTNSNGSQSSGSAKLDDAKKKVCQQNENRMMNMFTNMNQLGQGQLDLFNGIAERAQTYYTQNNLSVNNYDQLVKEVQRTRTAAENTIQTATQTSSQFGCDKDDPKGVAGQYKVQVKTQVQALKEYRTAIKNLISAIEAAA